MNTKGKLVKSSPNKRRTVHTTLAAYQHFDFHVDLIGYCYEMVTEEEEEEIELEDFELLGTEIYRFTNCIKTQLGLEKYIELTLFIKHLKKCYVLDLRDESFNIATKKTLVSFYEDGTKNIKLEFDAILILKELEKFVINPAILKRIAEKFRK